VTQSAEAGAIGVVVMVLALLAALAVQLMLDGRHSLGVIHLAAR
jgi:hypothetical protein